MQAKKQNKYTCICSYPYKSSTKWWLSVEFVKRFAILLMNTLYTRNNVSDVVGNSY